MRTLYLGQLGLDQLIERTKAVFHQEVLLGEDDLMLFCEHPPVLSLGKNFKGFSRGEMSLDSWKERGVGILSADRGGQATYHGPGHLMVYPVINLKKKNLGVKKFIEIFLNSMIMSLAEIEIGELFIDEKKVGVWCEDTKQKLVSLGLRIDRGVTRHGASIYVDGDLEPFNWFSPCGYEGDKVCSIEKIYNFRGLDRERMDFSKLKYILMSKISNNLESLLRNF